MALTDKAVHAQEITERYAIYHADCMEVLRRLPDGAAHCSMYSPPFGGLYKYSSSDRDLSNNSNYGQFFEHYGYVVEELARVTMPGRMSLVHCMDVPSGNSGCDHLVDFPGDIIRLHMRCRKEGCTASDLERETGRCGHGWFQYTARYHVWKEPLRVRMRTMAKGLTHQTIVEDSSRCSVASADYLLCFRRAGTNPVPIAHPQGLSEYAGFRPVPPELLKYRGWTGKQTQNRLSHWIWRRYADAFWDDIRLSRVLPYKAAKDIEDEEHVHPLQLDVIERAYTLYTNPGERVVVPFAGVGSEVWQAVRMGRLAIGAELKDTYYRQMMRNMSAVDAPEPEQGALFPDEPEGDAGPDLMSDESEAA